MDTTGTTLLAAAVAPAVALQDSLELSPGLVVLIGAVVVVQVGLLVAALVDLLRRPDEAVTGGRRWVWVVVVVLVQTIGPLVYFAAGRRPRPVADPQPARPASPEDPARRTVELLYGPPEEPAQPEPGRDHDDLGGRGV
jgi:hypothetical protein